MQTKIFSKKQLWQLILPLIIELLLNLLVGMIDSIMVSSVGESAVSGVSLVDTVMQLLIYLFSALGTGGAVVAGQYLGRDDKERARESSEQLVWFSGLFSIAVMAGLLCLKNPILNHLFGQITPEVHDYANIYLIITAFSVPGIAIYQACAATFRTMGNSKVTMWISLLMNIINCTGNAILIYGMRMGTAGAAIATLLSRTVAAVVIVVLLFNPKRQLYLRRTCKVRLKWNLIKRVLSIGAPNGLENGMFQLGKILVLSLISLFGTQAIAANAIGMTIAGIQVIPGSAIALALTTVIARCVGKGDYEQAKYYNRLLIFLTCAAMLVLDWSLYFALPWILPFYHLSAETAELTRQMVLVHTACAGIIWPITFDLPASMRAAGDARFAMVISIISMWVFRIGTGYLLALGMHMGAIGVWIAMVIDWMFRAIVFSIRWRSGKWRAKSVI